jgi:hypothetical protein
MKPVLAALLLASLPTAARADDPPVPELAELLRKAAAYRPAARDLVWRQIPWHTEAADALAQAKAESRPLFVWLAGGRGRDGSPLERC